MIRKNLLLCKIIRIKTSSKSLFDSYMALFRPELETCPICGSTGNCHIHDYYGRSIIDFKSGRQKKSDLCVLRVFCDSCNHAHAILPDIIIPYSSYSLFFVLRILGEYFSDLYTIEQLCERYGISRNQLFKWLALFRSHKQEWLGLLSDAEVSDSHPSPWSLSGAHRTPSSSRTGIPYWHLPKTHDTIRPFSPRISPSSDHTAMGWQMAISPLMIKET